LHTEGDVVRVLVGSPDLPSGERGACRGVLRALGSVANSGLRATGQHANATIGGEEASDAEVRVLTAVNIMREKKHLRQIQSTFMESNRAREQRREGGRETGERAQLTSST
jgi:hypothetical protein